MVFSSLTFLCVFLPVVFGLYLIMPGIRTKNILLIIFSFLFYAYGEPVYVLLMLFSTFANWGFGLALEKGRRRRSVLVVCILLNLGLLGVFKYTDMIVGTLNTLFATNFALTGIELPIGISFYTFQAMSYVIDVYKGDVKAQKNYLNVALYVSFFPQLIAGPIVKYHDIDSQITNRHAQPQQIAAGLRRFIIGLAKKVLIANTMAVCADTLYAVPMDQMNMASAWLAAGSYLLQIYFDFSGYSDMAIGMGRMFGFHFPENFNYPYSAVSMQDFWRRWHISLTSWFRQYLYIPLGGNRRGRIRTAVNKLIVFFCTGLWHGPAWTFVVWGMYNGAFLLMEDAVHVRRWPRLLGHLYTILAAMVGFVIFRAETLEHAGGMIAQMFWAGSWSNAAVGLLLEQLSPVFVGALILGAVFSFPVLPRLRKFVESRAQRRSWAVPLSYAASVGMLLICMLNLSSGTYNPFIYFRF